MPQDLLPLHRSLEEEFKKMQRMIHNNVSITVNDGYCLVVFLAYDSQDNL